MINITETDKIKFFEVTKQVPSGNRQLTTINQLYWFSGRKLRTVLPACHISLLCNSASSASSFSR